MFSIYCKKKFTVEAVEVIDYNDKHTFYPKLEVNEFTVDIDYLNRISGTNLIVKK